MTYLEEKNLLPDEMNSFQTGFVNEDHVSSLTNLL